MVRKTAAWALGNIADETAIACLTDALQDEDGEVRQAAQQALDFIKNEKKKKSAEAPPVI
jgi:HEAT repeat protein